MADKENPPAFPVIASQQVYTHGMTMRDYFAAQALASIGTWMPEHGGGNLATVRAQMARATWAYDQADAMLKARAIGADRG